MFAGLRPVRQPLRRQAREHLVEGRVVEQKGIVLQADRVIVVVVQRHSVIELHDQHRAKRRRGGQPEQVGQERCRTLLVAAPDDGVIELHAHG
ncbi:hypothetical protein D3C80_1631790 [compost metagenome]